MKKHFFTGLIVILPFFITVYIVWLVFRIVGTFFTPAFTRLFEIFLLVKIPDFIITIFSAVVTAVLIYLVGVLVSNIIGKRILQAAESLLMKIPMANGIYDAIRKLIDVFFSNKSNFKRVVLIEWPRKGVYSIAFITAEAVGEVQESTKEDVVNVFMPTTPNPTTGFLVLVPKSDIIPLKMSVDDAVKLIISGGIVVPPPSRQGS